MRNDLLVWVDSETTGLYEDFNMQGMHKHKILEVAIRITDSQLNLIDEGLEIVIHHERDDVEVLMNDFVKKMHTKNGLIDKVVASTITLEKAQSMMLAYLEKNGVAPKSSPICGNSISFDKMFLLAQMPDFMAKLHYRTIDVSSFKEIFNRLFPEKKNMVQKNETHRALDDIIESIQEMKFYQSYLNEPVIEKKFKP